MNRNTTQHHTAARYKNKRGGKAPASMLSYLISCVSDKGGSKLREGVFSTCNNPQDCISALVMQCLQDSGQENKQKEASYLFVDNNNLFQLGQKILLFTSSLALSTQRCVLQSTNPHKHHTALPQHGCAGALQVSGPVPTFTLHFSSIISVTSQVHHSAFSHDLFRCFVGEICLNPSFDEVPFFQISKMQHKVKRFQI